MLLDARAIVSIAPERPEQRRASGQIGSSVISEHAPSKTDHTRAGARDARFQPDRDDAAVGKVGGEDPCLKAGVGDRQVVMASAERREKIAARVGDAGPVAVRLIFRLNDRAAQRTAALVLHVKRNQHDSAVIVSWCIRDCNCRSPQVAQHFTGMER